MKTLIGYFDKFNIKNEFGVLQIRFGKSVQDRAMAGVVAYQLGNAIYVAECNGEDEQIKVISTNYTMVVGTIDELLKMRKGME